MAKWRRALLGCVALGGVAAAARWRRQTKLSAQRHANRNVRVLIVGAGVIGTSYAAYLARHGMDVDILAREPRARILREHGLEVRDLITRRAWVEHATVLSRLRSDREYDLAIVAVRYPQALEAIQGIAEIARTTPVLLLGSFVGQPDQIVRALDARSLLMGYPCTTGAAAGNAVQVMPLGLSATIIGESSGARTLRLQNAAAILRRAGLKVEIVPSIVSWLNTQAAMTTVLTSCVARTGGSIRALASQPQQMSIYRQALDEALSLLDAAGVAASAAVRPRFLECSPRVQQFLLWLASLPHWVAPSIEQRASRLADETAAFHDYFRRLSRESRQKAPSLRLVAQALQN